MNITTEFFIFELVWVPIFSLNWYLRFLEQVCYFQSKTDKTDTTIEFCIFELVFTSNFTLNKQFWIFWTKFDQGRYLWSKIEKSEHHHWIPLIQISLATKLQLKLTTLIFFFDQRHWNTGLISSGTSLVSWGEGAYLFSHNKNALWGRCFTSTSFALHLFLAWSKLNLTWLSDQLRVAYGDERWW